MGQRRSPYRGTCTTLRPRISTIQSRRSIEGVGTGQRWFAAPGGSDGDAPALVPPCSRLLAESVATQDASVQGRALDLCAILLRQPQGAEAISSGRDLVAACLVVPSAAVRHRP